MGQTSDTRHPCICLRRPYHVECTGSLSTSEVKQRRARSVLGWGTAWEDLRVLSAFLILCIIIRLLQHGATCDVLHCGVFAVCEYHNCHDAFCFTRGRAPSAAPQKNEEKGKREKRMKKEKRADTIQCLKTAVRVLGFAQVTIPKSEIRTGDLRFRRPMLFSISQLAP